MTIFRALSAFACCEAGGLTVLGSAVEFLGWSSASIFVVSGCLPFTDDSTLPY
jgi:hypothetical protein